MHKKAFTFGMGIGILLIALIFYFVYGWQEKRLIKEFSASSVREMSEDEIIDKARGLGMVFPADATNTPAPVYNTPQAVNTPPKFEYVDLRIPEGAAASKIAEILMDNGVIKNADEFTEYIVGAGYATRLAYGSFRLPVNADYELLLEMIKRK